MQKLFAGVSAALIQSKRDAVLYVVIDAQHRIFGKYDEEHQGSDRRRSVYGVQESVL